MTSLIPPKKIPNVLGYQTLIRHLQHLVRTETLLPAEALLVLGRMQVIAKPSGIGFEADGSDPTIGFRAVRQRYISKFSRHRGDP